MKNKILKAINEGIMKALSTDITDQDIDFSGSEINNEFITEISLEELYQKFQNNNDSIFEKFNTKNAVSLILDHNVEISLYEYEDGMNPMFIKISNDDLRENNNEILIYIPENHCVDKKCWQANKNPEQVEIRTQIQPDEYVINYKKRGRYYKEIASSDYTGYQTCNRIMKCKGENKVPAVEYCLNLNKEHRHGYLPAAGQLLLIKNYLKMINYILNKLSVPILHLGRDEWWSSTEETDNQAWVLFNGLTVFSTFKSYERNVLPLFTLKTYID